MKTFPSKNHDFNLESIFSETKVRKFSHKCHEERNCNDIQYENDHNMETKTEFPPTSSQTECPQYFTETRMKTEDIL